MKLTSTKRIESKVLSGVTLVIRKINKRRRDDIEDLIRPIIAKFPDREEYAALDGDRGKDKLSDEKEARWWALTCQAARLYNAEVQPIIVRMGFVRFEGLEIENENGETEPATLDNLHNCSDEADALYAELVEAVEHERGLSQEEAKNSDSPSISAAAEGGKQDNADPVGMPETITRAAA